RDGEQVPLRRAEERFVEAGSDDPALVHRGRFRPVGLVAGAELALGVVTPAAGLPVVVHRAGAVATGADLPRRFHSGVDRPALRGQRSAVTELTTVVGAPAPHLLVEGDGAGVPGAHVDLVQPRLGADRAGGDRR